MVKRNHKLEVRPSSLISASDLAGVGNLAENGLAGDSHPSQSNAVVRLTASILNRSLKMTVAIQLLEMCPE
jgi:hypothetical protein